MFTNLQRILLSCTNQLHCCNNEYRNEWIFIVCICCNNGCLNPSLFMAIHTTHTQDVGRRVLLSKLFHKNHFLTLSVFLNVSRHKQYTQWIHIYLYTFHTHAHTHTHTHTLLQVVKWYVASCNLSCSQLSTTASSCSQLSTTASCTASDNSCGGGLGTRPPTVACAL